MLVLLNSKLNGENESGLFHLWNFVSENFKQIKRINNYFARYRGINTGEFLVHYRTSIQLVVALGLLLPPSRGTEKKRQKVYCRYVMHYA